MLAVKSTKKRRETSTLGSWSRYETNCNQSYLRYLRCHRDGTTTLLTGGWMQTHLSERCDGVRIAQCPCWYGCLFVCLFVCCDFGSNRDESLQSIVIIVSTVYSFWQSTDEGCQLLAYTAIINEGKAANLWPEMVTMANSTILFTRNDVLSASAVRGHDP